MVETSSEDFETQLTSDFSAVVALKAAFAMDLMDGTQAGADARTAAFSRDRSGAVLRDLLVRAGILEARSAELTRPMRELLAARGDALRSVVEFTAMAAADCLNHADTLFAAPSAFMAKADTFAFFQYGRAGTTKALDVEATEPWVRYVSALSEREGPLIAPLMPLDGVRQLLDIGGNSGAFAVSLMDFWPDLEVTVFDLPAVTHIGARLYKAHTSGGRLHFFTGDARTADLPEADAIVFKSVLHDWSEPEARAMLSRAAEALPDGGRLLIVERGPIEDDADNATIGLAPNLVFARFYRSPDLYEAWMRDIGLHVDERRSAMCDMTFHIVIGRKS